MLILKDAKKYFEKCFNGSWSIFPQEVIKIFEEFAPDALDIIKGNGIQIADG